MIKQLRKRLLQAIEAFTLTEKIIFYFFVFVFASSSLFLLTKVNDNFLVEVPTYGGEIKEGVLGYPRYINPLLSITDSGRDLSALIYSGLLKANPDGSLTPDLAKSYSVSEDGLTYTFELKDNIFFHDNYPVTAYDVEFTIKRILDPALKSPKAPNFEGVETHIISDKKIEFILKHSYAPFIENMTLGILPEHLWKDIDTEGFLFSQLNFEPIGSGPYRVKDIKRNESGLPIYYHLVPFEKNSLGVAYINDYFVYFFTNEEKLLAAYQDGIINSVNSISPENAVRLNNSGTIIRSALPRIFGVFFNQNEAPLFTNKEVRLALNEAIDKDRIIQEVLGGYGTKAVSALPNYLSEIEDSTKTAEERITSAKAILTKAGWTPNSEGIMTKTVKKETTTLSFSISTGNAPELKKTALLVKEMWEKIGAKVDVKFFDLADLQQNVIRPRKYDAILFGEVVGRDLDLFAFWHSSERNDPGLNMAMYTNVKVDKLLSQARAEEDREKRITLLKSIEKEIDNDVPAVFLYSPDFIYVVPKNLRGISITGITSATERFLEVEKWYMNTEKVWTFFK